LVDLAAVCQVRPYLFALNLSERSLLCNRLHTGIEEERQSLGAVAIDVDRK